MKMKTNIRNALLLLIAFVTIIGLFQYLTPIYNTVNAYQAPGGGTPTPTPTPPPCSVSKYCSGNVCGTGTYLSGAGGACRCLPVSGNCSTKQSGNSYQCGGSYPYIVGVACPTPTPPPPPPSPTISNDPTFYDNSTGQNLAVNSTNGYDNDNVTARVYVTNASSVSASIYESDDQGDGLSWSNNPSITNFGGGWYGFSFNLDPLNGSPVSREHYTWAVQFWASGYGTAYSNKDNITMIYPYTYPFHCNSTTSGKLIASNLSGAKDIVLFDNDPSNACASSYYFNNSGVVGQHIYLPPSAPWASAYNNDQKDSIIFFPTGKVTDSQCTPGTPAYDEAAQTVAVTGLSTGNVWLVHWCYSQTANVYNSIDPASVRVTPLVVGVPSHTTDMEIDSLNGGQPKYFWYSVQNDAYFRINWSNIMSVYNGWRSTNFGYYNSPVDVNSCTTSTNVGAQGCVFEYMNSASLNGYYFNGIKTLNSSSNPGGETYLPYIQNSNSHRVLSMFNPQGASYPYPSQTMDTGLDGSGFSIPGYVFLQPDGGDGGVDKWHLDGMTASPDSKYIFLAASGGRLIFVFYNTDTSSPQYVGLVPIVGSPNTAPNGGFDGIEIDQNWQLYLANETQGIWSANAHDVINAAWQNGGNIRATNWVQATQYVGNPAGEDWDDIAPLSGTGASNYTSYGPYINTRMGSVYSDGGFSISSLNKAYDSSNGYFSTYGLLSNTTNPTINNGTGSLYSWEFNSYASEIVQNHSAPKNNYQALFSQLQSNTQNVFTAYPYSYINGSTSLTDTLNGKNQIYTYTGDLTIDGTNGGSYSGINANGIIFVNGNVYITANPFDQFNSGHLVVVATGNISINPTTYYSSSNSSSLNIQHVNLGLISNESITTNPYLTFPNYVEPMQVKGIMVDYGQGYAPGTKSTNFNFDIGYFDRWVPAEQVIYDPAYINELSKYFVGTNSPQEVGL